MSFVNKAKLHGIPIDVRGVFSSPILKRLAERIANRSRRFHCDIAIPVRQYGSGTPLFMLPDGGGDISYAFELAQDIDKDVPIYVLPWSSPDEKQLMSIEEMANAMILLMRSVRPNGPCAIAGYSHFPKRNFVCHYYTRNCRRLRLQEIQHGGIASANRPSIMQLMECIEPTWDL